MPKPNLEIVRNGDNITLRARVQHGPGDLHSLTLTPAEVLALRNASRSVVNKMASAQSASVLGCGGRGLAGEEDMKGVGSWSPRPTLTVSGAMIGKRNPSLPPRPNSALARSLVRPPTLTSSQGRVKGFGDMTVHQIPRRR